MRVLQGFIYVGVSVAVFLELYNVFYIEWTQALQWILTFWACYGAWKLYKYVERR